MLEVLITHLAFAILEVVIAIRQAQAPLRKDGNLVGAVFSVLPASNVKDGPNSEFRQLAEDCGQLFPIVDLRDCIEISFERVHRGGVNLLLVHYAGVKLSDQVPNSESNV